MRNITRFLSHTLHTPHSSGRDGVKFKSFFFPSYVAIVEFLYFLLSVHIHGTGKKNMLSLKVMADCKCFFIIFHFCKNCNFHSALFFSSIWHSLITLWNRLILFPFKLLWTRWMRQQEWKKNCWMKTKMFSAVKNIIGYEDLIGTEPSKYLKMARGGKNVIYRKKWAAIQFKSLKIFVVLCYASFNDFTCRVLLNVG